MQYPVNIRLVKQDWHRHRAGIENHEWFQDSVNQDLITHKNREHSVTSKGLQSAFMNFYHR
ncbi:hypothetical protein MH215_17710 [Paenibacillus sp. ACRSA]|uniref:hypothetical protein n=1 Tax=Paenibacillus sp. ACRSA TaxID=2918211 RepID=UPI001EF5AD1C|nr:hypothetical protein [Paenibacillus sp. ACRSA]MCG7378850.1 hypothetical protein [Paenibacillus sp. ACRSA]